MLNKIAEFILDKRLREMEERIKALEDKFKHPTPPRLKTPPIYNNHHGENDMRPEIIALYLLIDDYIVCKQSGRSLFNWNVL